MKEITFRSIIIGSILAIILAASNTFLALKIGILTSASIPAAVISMGILRFFKKSTTVWRRLSLVVITGGGEDG